MRKNKACVSLEENQEAADRTPGRFGSWRLQPTSVGQVRQRTGWTEKLRAGHWTLMRTTVIHMQSNMCVFLEEGVQVGCADRRGGAEVLKFQTPNVVKG